MNSGASTPPSRDSRLPLIATLTLLATALIWFAARKAHYLTNYSPASYTSYFWPRRVGLVVHLVGGLTAIVAGLIQIWLGLTHRTGPVHRALGKIYATAIGVGSIGGFYLAYTIPEQLAYKTGFIFLNAAWLITTGMALYAVHHRLIEQHREWMLRSYTVTFAFVSYRLGEALLRQWIVLGDVPDADDIAITMAWGCWAVPLLIAEPLIQLRSMRRLENQSRREF